MSDDFIPASSYMMPDIHDDILDVPDDAMDTLSYEAAPVIAAGMSTQALRKGAARYRQLMRCMKRFESVLVMFSWTHAGKRFLSKEGWHFQDIAVDMPELLKTAGELLSSNPDAYDEWVVLRAVAPVTDFVASVHWRDNVRAATHQYIVKRPDIALMITAYVDAEYSAGSKSWNRRNDYMISWIYTSTGFSERKDWLLESYALLGQYLNIDEVMAHKGFTL